jgi:alanine dehydrogenase
MSEQFSTGKMVQPKITPQAEMLSIPPRKSKLFIGIPKERSFQENRVALVPSSVASLVGAGHRILIESKAGEKSNFSDLDYTNAGAEIGYDLKKIFEADIILKVAPLRDEEIELLKPNQILITPLHLPTMTREYLEKIKHKRVIALAKEYIKDDFNSFPIVRILSEIAGYSAVLTAAELLSISGRGTGVLLGGISGVPSAKIVILGAGVVGEYATRAALGLGAEVRIFDNNINKLMRLQNNVGRKVYTSVLNPFYLESELIQADVAIGALHSKIGRTPILVTEEVVSKMKPGAAIIDVSIDQGGCFETSEVTDHKNPTFVKHEVIHYCVPNIASKVARTASIATSNILSSILFKAAGHGSIEHLLYDNTGLRNGVYMYKGCLTNEYLGKRFDMKSMDLSLLLTSSI